MPRFGGVTVADELRGWRGRRPEISELLSSAQFPTICVHVNPFAEETVKVCPIVSFAPIGSAAGEYDCSLHEREGESRRE